jgi:hypothetical protein
MDIQLLQTIRNETRPVERHPDPGAIEDCWDEVIEQLLKDVQQVAEMEMILREVEGRLVQDWKDEARDFAPQHRDMKDRPDLMAPITDQYAQPRYPTAALLTKVRTILKGTQS